MLLQKLEYRIMTNIVKTTIIQSNTISYWCNNFICFTKWLV